jgi:hypothetical protein
MLEFCSKPFKLKPAPRDFDRGRDHVAQPRAKRLADRRRPPRTHVLAIQRGRRRSRRAPADRAGERRLPAHLQAAGVSYFFCGAREVNLPLALDKLARPSN